MSTSTTTTTARGTGATAEPAGAREPADATGPATPPAATADTATDTARPGTWRAFFAILRRDMYVTFREGFSLLAQIALAPLFMLFVFAKVLGSLDYVSTDFGSLLLPGIVALSAFLASLQGVGYNLVIDFGVSREIEDRLLAPIPVTMVALEKMTMATLRGVVAAVLIFPIGALVLGTLPWRASGVPLLLVVLPLGAWAGAAIGITLGTLASPSKVSLVFALIMTPLMFTGATQYPLVSLDSMRWFQVLTAMNPLTYVSEGVRAALAPSVPHLAPWMSVSALSGFAALFTVLGIHCFRRRAIG